MTTKSSRHQESFVGAEVVAQNKPEEKRQETNGEELTQIDDEAWGAGENVDYADLQIPRLLISQSLSKVRDEGVADGEIYDSVLREKLPQPVKMLVLEKFSTWREIILPNRFKSEYPLTPENANQPREYEGDEGLIRRDKAINYYVLLTDPLAPIPALVSFSRGSHREGNRLLNIFVRMAVGTPKRSSASQVVELRTEKASNDKGSWYVYKINMGRPATAEEKAAAKHWAGVIAKNAAAIKVHQEPEDVPDSAYGDEDINF